MEWYEQKRLKDKPDENGDGPQITPIGTDFYEGSVEVERVVCRFGFKLDVYGIGSLAGKRKGWQLTADIDSWRLGWPLTWDEALLAFAGCYGTGIEI